jgi:hypothetical protein
MFPAATAASMAILVAAASATAADAEAGWTSLWNGRNLDGWDSFLSAPPGSDAPLGLNNDPRGVFTVVETDGAPAIRVSGEIYGAITTREEFGNFHLRLEIKWGEKRWPPRAEVGRDTGILYCCTGKPNPGTGWMTSVENNIMERGIGQWWSVNGAVIDVEGEHVTPEMEARVPYKKESSGEKIIVWKKGAPRLAATPAHGITPPFDDEKPRGEWNTVETIFWAGQCLHLLNGRVNMVLTNPRASEAGKVVPLRTGRIQLQSEGAECFYRKVEVRPLGEIPAEYLGLIPAAAAGEEGFQPLLGKDAKDGWKQCGAGDFEVKEGVATGRGGMGLWWHSRASFSNFILRGEFLQEQEGADSGVFFRFPDPGADPWAAVRQGHEMEIGDPAAENPTWRTGSIYPFHAPVKAASRPAGQWNAYEIVCDGHDYSVRLNGELVNTWSDPKKRSASGHIGLQNYDDGKTVRHRNLRVKVLP